jgi:hypothetical protein
MNRDFKVKIETEEAFFADLIAQAERIDQGIIPEKTVHEIFCLLARGETEIEAGVGFDLERVLAEADARLANQP